MNDYRRALMRRLTPLALLAAASTAALAQQNPPRNGGAAPPPNTQPPPAPNPPPAPPTNGGNGNNNNANNRGANNATPPPAPPANTNAGIGQPLAGLTDAQLIAFTDGQADFNERETPATGLGPIFNDVSCVACHRAPAVGGTSGRSVTRFGRAGESGFDPLTALGGSLLQERAIAGVPREVVPAVANVTAVRITTPLFGAGLIEAIPDATIALGTLAAKPAGVRGKVSIVRDIASGENRVGRFGWKAQQATLLAFSADAYANEMGITNRFFPEENAPNGDTAAIARFVHPTTDDAIDPADGRSGVDRLADFMRLLAPPPAQPFNASAAAGQRLFTRVGCASCHTPSLTTGPSEIAALHRQPVPLYSDLLLHDMGALGDGIAQGTAGPQDMRTAPLWGLRARNTLLHDGRARTPDAAIRAHEGEAAGVRDAYTQLNATERQQLLDFLGAL